MQRAILLTTLLLAASSAAIGADNGIYVGGSLGQAQTKIELTSTIAVDGDDTGFKFIAGIRPLDWLAIEANYVDFGKVEERGLEVEVDGISAFAVGFLPVGPVDLFAKGGLVTWDGTLGSNTFGGGRISEDGTDLAYGVGAAFRLGSIAVRAEYEIFDADDIEDLNMASIGLTWTFL
jgi:hypothetical protein